MAPDGQGGLLLAGQHRLPRDGPVGLPVEAVLGGATDVVASTRLVQQSGGQSTYEVTLANHRRAPVVVEVRDPSDGRRVTEASQAQTVKDAHFVWRVELAPGQVETLRYTIGPSA